MAITLAPSDLLGLMTEKKILDVSTADGVTPTGLDDAAVVAGVNGAVALADSDMWGPLLKVAVKYAAIPPGWATDTMKRLTRFHLFMLRPEDLVSITPGVKHPIVLDYERFVGTPGKAGILDMIGSGNEALPDGLTPIPATSSNHAGLKVSSNPRVFGPCNYVVG